jgi:hypothetical protein
MPCSTMAARGLHLITPSAEPKTARVEALLDFPAKRMSSETN